MKKLTALFLAIVMSLSLVACGGGPDKQPAIDAYNQVSKTYNEFVEIANHDLSGWAEEDIDFMNSCADLLSEYADKLEGDTEFTQEEIDEMVDMFNEFNGVIEDFMAEIQG